MYGAYIYITLALKNKVYKFVPCMVELKQFFAFFGGRFQKVPKVCRVIVICVDISNASSVPFVRRRIRT